MQSVGLFQRVLFSLLIAGVAQGCQLIDGPCEKGKGTVIRREFPIETFSGINMTMVGNVEITKGEEVSVELEGQENILDLISSEVKGGLWTIYPRNCVSNVEGFKVYITVPALDNITVTGSGAVNSTDNFEEDINILLSGSGQIVYEGAAEAVIIALTGSGKITFGGDFSEVSVSHSGSGNLSMSGSTGFLRITNSGSGAVNAFGMLAVTGQVINSGSGSSSVYVTDGLEASVSGSGSIFYKGNPVIEESDSGSGNIVNAN